MKKSSILLSIFIYIFPFSFKAQVDYAFSYPGILPASDLESSNPASPQLDPNKIHLVILGDGYHVYDENIPGQYELTEFPVSNPPGSGNGVPIINRFFNKNIGNNYLGRIDDYAYTTNGSLGTTCGDAEDVLDYIFGYDGPQPRPGIPGVISDYSGFTPFKEYKHFFNTYRVLFNSENSPVDLSNGIGHPFYDNNNLDIACEDTQWATCANFLLSDRTYDGIVDTLTSLQRFNPNTTTKTSLLRYRRHNENQLAGVVRQSIEYCIEKDSLQALIPLYRDSLIGRGYGKHLLGIALDLDSVDVAVQVLDNLPSVSEDDSLFKSFASLAISLKQDSLHWSQLNTVQMEELRNLSRIPSSIQNNALSVRLLIGDTLYHHNPDPSPSGNARLAAPSSKAATQVWESAHVKLMPNPNLGTFQVQILDRLQGNIQWEMVDLTGRLMLQGQSNQAMFTIQASQLSKGIYVLKMRAPNGSMYKAERVIIR